MSEYCYNTSCDVVWLDTDQNLFWCACLKNDCGCKFTPNEGKMWCIKHIPDNLISTNSNYLCVKCKNNNCDTHFFNNKVVLKPNKLEIWWKSISREYSWYDNKKIPDISVLPTKCKNCSSEHYFEDSYIDDIYIVCGVCNHTAGYLPGYDPITGEKL